MKMTLSNLSKGLAILARYEPDHVPDIFDAESVLGHSSMALSVNLNRPLPKSLAIKMEKLGWYQPSKLCWEAGFLYR